MNFGPLNKMTALINRMNNHYANYDNGLDVSCLKAGDGFWMIGYNMAIDFIEKRGDKLIFTGATGETEVELDYFKYLMPIDRKND